jgi:hypothetical protein
MREKEKSQRGRKLGKAKSRNACIPGKVTAAANILP